MIVSRAIAPAKAHPGTGSAMATAFSLPNTRRTTSAMPTAILTTRSGCPGDHRGGRDVEGIGLGDVIRLGLMVAGAGRRLGQEGDQEKAKE